MRARTSADRKSLLEESGDAPIHRALLQTLLPGIVWVCRQLRFGEGIIDDPSETLAMALGLASELLVDWSGESRQYAAPDILVGPTRKTTTLAIEGEGRPPARLLLRTGRRARARRLASARATHSFRGSQYERIARITYARVFEGRSLRELASEDHSAPGTLQAELQHFAVRHLI